MMFLLQTVPITTWADGLSALKDALKLEASVTKKIKHVIKACENDNGANDYHVSKNKKSNSVQIFLKSQLRH